jgi:hypothetical protein
MAACQAPAPEGPDGLWTVPTDADARLSLPLRELSDPPQRARFVSADGRYTEETAQWHGADSDRPSAGLRLSEATPGPPLTDPTDPESVVADWAFLRDKRPSAGERRTGKNAYGPVAYWRVGVGTTVCVIFIQRLPPNDRTEATLSGYFCNPPGLPMPPQAAATVVESIGLRATAK